MQTSPVASAVSRREFVRQCSSLAALAAAGPLAFPSNSRAAEPGHAGKTVGIQVGAVSFVDEGTGKVLDILQERGAIDTIYLTTFTYGRGLAGRQIPGNPFPDHGKQVSDEKTFHGGPYSTPHPQFYANTALKPVHAPEHGDLDIVAEVLPEAKKRGMRLFCSLEDVFRADAPGVKDVAEVDLQGRKTGTLCLFHPDVRAFWTNLATDLCSSYEIDGILFFNERNGPLLNALGASHAQSIASSRVTCFCPHHQRAAQERELDFAPWTSKALDPLEIPMPEKPGLAILTLVLEDPSGGVLHRNFTAFRISSGQTPRDEILDTPSGRARVLRFAPASFSAAQWSLKQWNVLDGLKVNGAGSGYFEYRIPWPKDLKADAVTGGSLVFEASAKQLFGKDKAGAAKQEGDFMLGKGTHDPSLNPNAYPMTDTLRFPSAVQVRVAGLSAGVFDLPDDPADHRGILSWHSQKRDRHLREAGSYGYLVNATLPAAAIQTAAKGGELVIRFEVPDALAGGLAIYGESFGRYPLDPSLVLQLK